MAAEVRGEIGVSERLFREAVAADPKSALAHMNLGIALQAKSEFESAVAAQEEAIRLDPSLAGAHYNLALAYLSLDDFDRAETGFRAAVRLRPQLAEGWVGLAGALESTGRDHEALAALQTAVSHREHYVGALFNAAVILRRLGRLDEAETLLDRVPKDHPEFQNAMTALASILRDQGRIREAVEALRSAAQGATDSRVRTSELLFTLGFSDQVSAEELFAEHLIAGQRLEAVTPPWTSAFSNAADPERIIKIGYLSGDFRLHSVALFVEFLFRLHRRNRVKVYAYSSTPVQDGVTEKISASADGWRDVRESPDAAVAKVILDDGIDVLVDLSGHTSNSRIGVLAGHAAPVQLTWLGYMSTTGLSRVDYRITDSIADPPGMNESIHTERLARMPNSQWCFHPTETARRIPVVRDPSLEAFTFGVLNQFAKLSEASLSLFIQVLLVAPATRLRVVNVPPGSATEKLERRLVDGGLARERFDLVERLPTEQYYRQYALVDACLDTTPYSGGTTTCDALFLGVPVVTLAGRRSMSRSSASLLAAVGLPELVAHSPDEFVEIACALALKGGWSTTARAELRERMAASPLMDERRFTDDLENLYRGVWRSWCDLNQSVGTT